MKIGLALAGGGVKGAAHIGVLRALEESNIKIDYISGTSSGSIVAALYAMGYKYDEILNIFRKYSKKIKYIEWRNLFKLIYGILFERRIIINGLNSGDQLEKIVKEASEKKSIKNISQIKFPLLIPAVDLHNGEVYCFTSCDKNLEKTDQLKNIDNISIAKAVRASCSYPAVFSPCKYKNTELIDGGIAENIPWKGLKMLGADQVIGVIFDKELNKRCCPNLIDVIGNSLEIMSKELLNYEINGVDYLIKIKTEEISLLDMKKIDFLYNLGYQTAKRQLKGILV